MKKVLLTLILTVAAILVLATVSSAAIVHDETNVDYGATVELSNGTTVALFDEENHALTWYLDGEELVSIRTEDQRVKWYTETWDEVTGVGIHLDDGRKLDASKLVVVNMMDDHVVKNHGPGEKHYGKFITGFKYVFQGAKNLEYVYLRLDVTGIFRQSFNGCSKLKYVNIEDLTLLTRLGDSQHFSNCTEFFKGQVLDLSNTALKTIDGGGSFNNVHFTGIKFPSTLTGISSWTFQSTSFTTFAWPTTVKVMEGSMFKNNSSLESICLSNSLTKIDSDAFLGCTSLNKIFYVGTLDEFDALLANVNTTNNDPFFNVANGKKISYAEYQALEDKSGSYVVYGYSWCEAYNDGNHEVEGQNPCVGFCSVCECNVVSHDATQDTSVRIDYSDFSKAGVKTVYCNNEGCTYAVKTEVSAVFDSLGYSVPESGDMAITLGFLVNKQALADYTSTGKEITYGVFAVLKEKLGENDIFDANGEAAEGVLSAEIKNRSFDAFEIKVTGFTEEQKDLKIAMGAYVAIANGDKVEYSYIQSGEPLEGDKYYFVSINSMLL